jgi:hypothetical protein
MAFYDKVSSDSQFTRRYSFTGTIVGKSSAGLYVIENAAGDRVNMRLLGNALCGFKEGELVRCNQNQAILDRLTGTKVEIDAFRGDSMVTNSTILVDRIKIPG